MILTGKAKEDFLNYYWSNYIGKTRFFNQKSETEDFFNSLYKTLKNALIIEWFDSVGIYIEILKDNDLFIFNIKGKEILFHDNYYKTRQEATEEAIKKACEIYNKN